MSVTLLRAARHKMISAFHSVSPYRSVHAFRLTFCIVCIAIPRIWLASFRIMDLYSSVGSLDNDWLQGIHISLLHVIISDYIISVYPCCGRYILVKLQKS